MARIYITFFLFIFFSTFAYSQEKKEESPTKSAINWTIGGQITLSTDFKQNIFLNFAGPGIKLSDKSKKSPWAFSINMFPSMRCNTQEKDSNKIFTPLLGAGFQIFYKKLVISMPSYYISAQNIWVGTLGLGYSF